MERLDLSGLSSMKIDNLKSIKKTKVNTDITPVTLNKKIPKSLIDIDYSEENNGNFDDPFANYSNNSAATFDNPFEGQQEKETARIFNSPLVKDIDIVPINLKANSYNGAKDEFERIILDTTESNNEIKLSKENSDFVKNIMKTLGFSEDVAVVEFYKSDYGYIKITLENGGKIEVWSDEIWYAAQNGRFDFDKNGNLLRSYGTAYCFDLFNAKGTYDGTGQFGGSQMDFNYNIEELLADPIIINKIREYFPEATLEDCELYLYKICNVGCGYTAMVNTIFKEFYNREQEFYKIFGFPMYEVLLDGKVDYNYEYLILDYFNFVWGSSGHTIQELYGIIDSSAIDAALLSPEERDELVSAGIATGLNEFDMKNFTEFLKEKYSVENVKINIVYDSSNFKNKDYYVQETIDKYENIVATNPESQIIISVGTGDIFTMDETRSREIGAHAMYVTGITSGNKFIVSSWGDEYLLDISSIPENSGYSVFTVVNFN